ISLVERPPGGRFHGRRGVALAWRRDGRGGSADQAGDPSRLHCGDVRGGTAQRDSAGGQLQAAKETYLQNGSDSPPFRSARMAGIEDHCAFLDHGAGNGAVRAHHAETAMKALVVGMEKSGRAAAEFLRGQGVEVTATDLKPHDVPGFRLQSDELFDGRWDRIVISPGVPADLPGLARARERGVEVIGEVELAAPSLRGPVIGITGSNGKTTT